MYDVLILISQNNITTDQYGREVVTESSRQVFCEVFSVTQSEFYAASDADLKPEYRFNVFFGDYEGEKIVEYKGERYAIYRTYHAGDYMELYVERQAGI